MQVIFIVWMQKTEPAGGGFYPCGSSLVRTMQVVITQAVITRPQQTRIRPVIQPKS